MARVLLVGQGPFPSPGVERLGFAQLRLLHFDRVLREAGHAVRTAVLDGHEAGGSGWEGHFGCTAASLGPLVQGADVVVTAGPYAPGAAGARVARELPLWVDLPGDPFAELQAQAIAGPVPAERVAATLAHALPALARADAISTVSHRQRLAALGQLGVLGRLVDAQAQDHVVSIPIAWDFPVPRAEPRQRSAGEPLVLALSGGFNAWFDAQTLVDGLRRAFAAEPALRLVATGGPLPHHPAEGYEALSAWASTQGDRVRLAGWVPHAQVPSVLSEAHVGISLDRPGLEPLLGSRTRVLLFAWLGLSVVATRSTELVCDMADADVAYAVPVGDPEALADALVALVHDEPPPAAGPWLAERFDPTTIAAPLLRWVDDPRRAPACEDPTARLAAENLRLEAELAGIYETPTWLVLSRVHRWMKR